MQMSHRPDAVTPRDEHILTAREALEPLYETLERRTDETLMEAAVDAGWSPDEAVTAIGLLRLDDARSVIGSSRG